MLRTAPPLWGAGTKPGRRRRRLTRPPPLGRIGVRMSVSTAEPSQLSTASAPDFRPDKGRLEIIPARELSVIQTIQRTPTPARVRKLATNWNEEMVDLL